MTGQPDPRPVGRRVASREEWEKLRIRKLAGCRICGAGASQCSLHHLVPRSLGGDDVDTNLVALCGTGTTGCHGKIEARDPWYLNELRMQLLGSELCYILNSKGEDWLDRYYPLLNGAPADTTTTVGGGSVGEGGTGVPVLPVSEPGVDPSLAASAVAAGAETAASPPPGSDCPTCQRRVPHPAKPRSPKSTPIGLRVPVDEEEAFKATERAAAEWVGVYEQPLFRFKLYSLALALVLQDESLKDFARRAA